MNRLRTAVLRCIVLLQSLLNDRMRKLTATPEAGVEDSPWKAIWMVGGAVLALSIIALVTAWVKGYIGKLPG